MLESLWILLWSDRLIYNFVTYDTLQKFVHYFSTGIHLEYGSKGIIVQVWYGVNHSNIVWTDA